ncbi:reverse transcriptase domain-containing protein [Paenibacillus agricola]|uniref:Group II intron reverse transcriptase/maturase n=1 Tax=Paenibacillus agricola TaxID=2716264 RepID=A0ABX0JEF1_9BACL|nr:reverse transcriptase domain-containing protein [Paenibacillus agricola]NHN33267.1 group II intron reverse transcriptase/maturase [Paenibacillus agricola]
MRVPNTVQTERDLQNVLDNLYEESKKGKSFTGILELINNEQTIVTAVHNIKSNKGSMTSGVDGKTINFYLQLPKEQLLGAVRTSLLNYNPKPVKRKFIPKRNGKKRPLGIPTILDRIIQECIRIVIEPILEARFFSHSYGFRPYRATGHAVARVVSIIHKQRFWCIEGDIKGFFDNVNHRLLIQKLERLGIIDKRVLAIIKKMLKARVLDGTESHFPSAGTPQGGVLSPLLANAYLNDFDWTISRMYDTNKAILEASSVANGRRALRGKGIEPVFLTRYADDWIIQTTTKEVSSRLSHWLTKYFKHKLKLELSDEKTLLTDCTSRPVEFLGYCISGELRRRTPSKPITKIVGKAYPSPKRVLEQKRDLIKQANKLLDQDEHLRAIHIERMNAKIVGIAEYWRQSIAKKILCKLDRALDVTLFKVFKKAYGDNYRMQKVRICNLANRPNRHKFDNDGNPVTRIDKSWAVKIEDQWIGVTKAAITPIKYCTKFNPILTPFSGAGRMAYAKSSNGRRFPISRPALYDDTTLASSLSGKRGIYNFEYMMNREYAFNQTLLKGAHSCPACRALLVKGYRNCHHKNSKLPMDKINKVLNLIWLCSECHLLVENGITEGLELTKNHRAKIEKLRTIKFGSNVGDLLI